MSLPTKADLVYQALRQRILSGDLRPGDPVPINHVAKDLGVSDIPAREAIKRLGAEGLLTLTPHKGAVIKEIGRQEIEELFAIATELESLALRQTAAHIGERELAELGKLLEAMERAYRGHRVEEYSRLNHEFHRLTYAAQPYGTLYSMIDSLRDATNWCLRIYTTEAGMLDASHPEHEAIYRALADRDAEAAVLFMRVHKYRTKLWVLRHLGPSEEDAGPHVGRDDS
ncbi:MAG: GntR family transcriptional regulator [Acidimicrobiaceae bacterium]|nr:GntR family transcriptional regulator [Acidimicrobiaceae bacterium]